MGIKNGNAEAYAESSLVRVSNFIRIVLIIIYVLIRGYMKSNKKETSFALGKVIKY